MKLKAETQGFAGGADHAPLEGQRQFDQRSGLHCAAAAALPRPDLRQQMQEFALPVIFFGAGDLGGLGQCQADGRVQIAFEAGENSMPYAVAGMPQVAIAGVFAPGLAQSSQANLQVFSAGGQERTDNSCGALWTCKRQLRVDSCQAAAAGAANDFEENGLSLIIKSVSGGDPIQTGLPEQATKILVAQFPCSSLDAEMLLCRISSCVATVAKEVQFMEPGKFGHKFSVGVGFGPAQLVVEVNDGENNANLGAELEQ